MVTPLGERHYSTREVMRFFVSEHLKDDLMREISDHCRDLADEMLVLLADSPQLTIGLRKLLEAKDCFVRAAM